MQKNIDKLISASPKPWEGIIAIEIPDVIEKAATINQAPKGVNIEKKARIKGNSFIK